MQEVCLAFSNATAERQGCVGRCCVVVTARLSVYYFRLTCNRYSTSSPIGRSGRGSVEVLTANSLVSFKGWSDAGCLHFLHAATRQAHLLQGRTDRHERCGPVGGGVLRLGACCGVTRCCLVVARGSVPSQR